MLLGGGRRHDPAPLPKPRFVDHITAARAEALAQIQEDSRDRTEQ